jgi:hypothetical protein
MIKTSNHRKKFSLKELLNIKRNDESCVAVIELTPQQKARIENTKPVPLVRSEGLPRGFRLKISENETLIDDAQKYIKDGVIEIG